MPKPMAEKMRSAAQRLGQFRAHDLANAAGAKTSAEIALIRNSIRDFVRRGEMERVSRGVYKYVTQKKVRTKMHVIWHLVRSHRRFTTDEIERLSGAKRYTVREYLTLLKDVGLLVKNGRQNWRLVKDPGPETPVSTVKRIKLATDTHRHTQKKRNLSQRR